MVQGHTTSGGLVRGTPKNHKSKVALRKVLPKRIENPKTALFMKGEKCSQVVQSVMTDFFMMKKPWAVKFSKKNEFRPFEESKHLEFLAFKNDASLFAFGSHQKKRPNNLTLGRHFDYQMLDMLELGVTKYEGIRSGARIMAGSKPLMLFHGELFESNPTLNRVQNLFVDFFRGRVVEKIQLGGLDHVIAITLRPKDPTKEITVSDDGSTVTNASLLFRQYCVALKRSDDRVPRVELLNVGPTIDFDIRRTMFANPRMFKLAARQPKGLVQKKEKNITEDFLGKKGQVHLGPQTEALKGLATRKFRSMKKKRAEDAANRAAERDAADADGRPEPSAAPRIKRRRSSGIGALAGSTEVGPSVMPNSKKRKH